jgi:hypothetical protein
MTGRVMTETETKKLSSFFLVYKGNKKCSSTNTNPES